MVTGVRRLRLRAVVVVEAEILHPLAAGAVHLLRAAVVAEPHLLWAYPNQGRQYWFWLDWAPRLCGRVASEKRDKLYFSERELLLAAPLQA